MQKNRDKRGKVVRVSCKVKVKNAQGLHVRPASAIVQILQGCRCSVHFTCRKETVNAKSIMSLLTLAASKNSSILIEADGEDAEAIVSRLVGAFEDQFGEAKAKL